MEVENFVMKLNEEHEVSVSAGQTPILRFSFPPGTSTADNFLLAVRNEQRQSCVFLGISDTTCPWNDEPRTLRNNKVSSRFLSLGYFPIRAQDYNGGFVLVFKETELSDCISGVTEQSFSSDSTKTLRVTVTKMPSSFSRPIMIAVVSFLLIGVLMVLVLTYCWHTKYSHCQSQEENCDVTEDSRANVERAHWQVYLPELTEKYKGRVHLILMCNLMD